MSRRFTTWLILGMLGCSVILQAASTKGREEGKNRFKKWLEEDVAYLITDEEKSIFQKLTTDEERERFIEQFWLRRDPNPSTSENEFKIEHYRRIAYANDHFQSGKAGWKTDRGRIYILFGPPDEINTYPSGQIYNRDLKEGGGHTTTFPYEVWFYRKIPGVGDGIEIEFVDSTLSGEYRMAISPEEKDALLYASGTGNTLLEEMGYETREDRIRNMGIKDVSGASMFRYGELNHVFERYRQFYQLRRPPEIQYKDLQQMVSSRIGYSMLPVEFTWDYIQLSPGMFMAPVTLAIPNEALTFEERPGASARAKVELYGMVQSLAGKIVYEFEDALVKELPSAMVSGGHAKGRSFYQRTIPLVPGRFKLSLVIKDTGSGNTSVLEKSLIIPTPPADGLFTSSLIVGDRVVPAEKGEVLTDPFVLEGNLKLYPNVTHQVRNGTSIAGYLEVYNLGVDSQSLKPEWSLKVSLNRDGRDVPIPEDAISSTYPVFKGDKLILFWMQTMRVPGAGPYDLRVEVKDKIKGVTASASTALSVY
jgi:GWxTD domain-containing protein